MSAEVIENHFDDLSLGVTLIDQPLHLLCEVELGMVLSDFDVSPSGLRLDKDEEVADSIALVIIIRTFELARLGRQWGTRLFDKLLT